MRVTCLYRHFSSDGVLLYVGISHRIIKRTIEHKFLAHWFDEVATIKIERCHSREEAITKEREAIKSEKPLYNVIWPAGSKCPYINIRRAIVHKIGTKDMVIQIRLLNEDKIRFAEKARSEGMKLGPWLTMLAERECAEEPIAEKIKVEPMPDPKLPDKITREIFPAFIDRTGQSKKPFVCRLKKK